MSELNIIHEIEEKFGIQIPGEKNNSFVQDYCFSANANNQIQYIQLSGLGITDIRFLKKLPNLVRLDLSNNQISDIEPLKCLSYLEILDLSVNKIKDIEPLGELNYLRDLNLTGNEIKDISVLGKLPYLTYIDLKSNEVADLIGLECLENIHRIVLWNNKISILPDWILKFNLNVNLENKFSNIDNGIYLLGNPLEEPPLEIVELGNNAINSYFNGGVRKAINEVKIILVGDGGAGKTSLSKVLRDELFDKNENQTHGVNIFKKNVDGVTVNFWDFGGQETMHATHQFFLSKRSLYILVLDSREEDKAEYWLKYIESFGGNSPILIVLNKIDQNKNFDVNRKFLQDKYKGIEGFYRLSCATREGLDKLKNDLLNTFGKVPLIRTKLPKRWFAVKEKLENFPTNDCFMDYQTFRRFCRQQKILDLAAQDVLAQYLNDLGVIIHFTDPQLIGTPVLKPRWITQAVYKIINFKSLGDAHGIFCLNDLPYVLDDSNTKDGFNYPIEKHQHIIELMKKFEICYEIDKNYILIPDLLEIQEPDFQFSYKDILRFRIRYDFLSKLIIPSFIVKRHLDIKDQLRWRTGVVLEDKRLDAVAVIKVDYQDKLIDFVVGGTQKRDYFSVIRKTFDEIHSGFDLEKFKFKELIPLPDYPKYEIEYDELIGYEKSGRQTYFIGKLGKEYSVSYLLNGIEPPEARQEGITINFKEAIMGNKIEINGNIDQGNIAGHDFTNNKHDIHDLENSQVQQVIGGSDNTATQNRIDTSKEKDVGLLKNPYFYLGAAIFIFFISVLLASYNLQMQGKLGNKTFKEIITLPITFVGDILKENK